MARDISTSALLPTGQETIKKYFPALDCHTLSKRGVKCEILLINVKSQPSKPGRAVRGGINLLEGRKQLLHYSS